MRAVEFFEGLGNRLSMMRLMLFISFFPASYVLLKNGTTEALGVYLGAYAALSGNNKWAERNNANSVVNSELEADSDSDTISASTATSSVVAKRRTQTSGRRKRPF